MAAPSLTRPAIVINRGNKDYLFITEINGDAVMRQRGGRKGGSDILVKNGKVNRNVTNIAAEKENNGNGKAKGGKP